LSLCLPGTTRLPSCRRKCGRAAGTSLRGTSSSAAASCWRCISSGRSPSPSGQDILSSVLLLLLHIIILRDCADLNFPQYLEKIKEPIALDVIKERLDDENNDQYGTVRAFLADLRKMFRNCFLFNSRESEIYRHAKKLEEKLDQLLQMWLPEFAFDPLTDVVDTNSKSNKR
jgi:hypothetical protein